MRIMLGVHDQVPALPVEFSEIFFAGAERINACSIDLEKISVLKCILM
jgi:hypothetical protein